MLRLIKQVLIRFLSCINSLVTKCLLLNNELCIIRPSLIDLNHVELSLNKCSGNYNATNDLSTKICVQSKTKDVNVKAFNIVPKSNEA